MTLLESVTLWQIQNEDAGYLDGIYIHEFIDKDALMDFIMMECSDMRTIDANTGYFHERVKMFFKTHRWNIDKLCETLMFDYLPLDNYHGEEDRTLNRDVLFNSVYDRDQTDETVTDRDQVEDEHTARDVSTVEHIDKHQTMHDDKVTDRDWTEKGTSNETDVNFVSAFNDKESPEQIGVDANGYPIYKYNDTEHHRDTINISYQKSGTEDITEVEDKQTDETQDRDETIDEDIQRDETIKEDIVVNDVLAEDIVKDDVTDEDVVEHKEKHGNNGQSYQSLIQEEREQAQFNIYKWILNHWCHELMVAIW